MKIKASFLFARILIAKLIGLPTNRFSKKWQFISKHWSIPMLWVFVRSLGRRVYIDQPCRYKPSETTSRTEYKGEHALTPEQIKDFHKNGFSGPHRVISEDDMDIFRQHLETLLETKSSTFGMNTVRDRHLDSEPLLELFSRPEIVEKIAQLLGPDLLLWRSQVFNQLPGAPPISMHQASTYMLEDFKQPILNPKDRNDLFQLTIWIAVDDSNTENGCMEFIPGSHEKINVIKLGGSGTFYNSSFELEHKYKKSEYVSMPLRPGEFVIFSERTIHGSPGNPSSNRRMGVNFRVVTPTTKVYSGRKSHSASHLKQTWKLKRWKCILLRGSDNTGYNKTK